jgi:hypothetical protein
VSWRTEEEPNSAMFWRGTDSIVNPWWEHLCWDKGLDNLFIGGVVCALGFGSFLAFAMAESYSPIGDQAWRADYFQWIVWTLVGLAGAGATWLVQRSYDWSMPLRFIRRDWMMSAGWDGLSFQANGLRGWLNPLEICRAGTRWAVYVDDIARVESGLTTDWQRVRTFDWAPFLHDKHGLVPPFEFQTFLYLNDGTRRVIRTFNADPEGCGSLAVSIRTWLEEARARRRENPLAFVEREGFAV